MSEEGQATLWEDEVKAWAKSGYIAECRQLGPREFLIVPGPIENFGFYFARELLPVDGSVVAKANRDGNYVVTFPEESIRTKYESAVFNGFKLISK